MPFLHACSRRALSYASLPEANPDRFELTDNAAHMKGGECPALAPESSFAHHALSLRTSIHVAKAKIEGDKELT
jgi:hypothetical protein